MCAFFSSCSERKQAHPNDTKSLEVESELPEPTVEQLSDKFGMSLKRELRISLLEDPDKLISVIIQADRDIDENILKSLSDLGFETGLVAKDKTTAKGTATSISLLDELPSIAEVQLSETRNTKEQ